MGQAELKKQIAHDSLQRMTDEPLSQTLRTVLGENQQAASHQGLYDEIWNDLEGFGPIGPLLWDAEVSEILINRFDQIFFEKKGVLNRHPHTFISEITFERLINRLLSEMKKVADQRHPLIDGTLADGTRVHVALPPVTKNPTISIRRHIKAAWTLQQLLEMKMLNQNSHAYLLNLIRERKNIVVCGATGSGKTTLLRALLDQCDDSERIVTIEDTSEIALDKANTVGLLTRYDPEDLVPEISLQALIVNALRMRPDRIVVGEVRGTEALLLLDALATGHRGSMSSLHACHPQQALRRLESLVSRGAPQWNVGAIRQLISDSIDVILVVERKNGLRQLTQAAQISGFESFGFLLDITPFS